MNKLTAVITLLCSFLMLPTITLGHGGEELGRIEKDGYSVTIDGEYGAPMAGQSAEFSIEIEKVATTTTPVRPVSPTSPSGFLELQKEREVDYTDILIEVTDPRGQQLFSGFVSGPAFSLYYANPGAHQILARFFRSGVVVTEATFPIIVAKNPNINFWNKHPDLSLVIVAGVLGLLFGSGIMWRVGRRGFS